MVKKKMKNEDTGDSTESCDEKQSNSLNSSGTTCSHISKSVDPTKLRKVIKSTGVETSKCSECAKEPSCLSINDDELLYEYANTVWMCLKCGTQLCGRARNQHALKHFETPRSDQHNLVADTSNWSVWCYACDTEVNASSSKKLLECITFAKKEAQRNENEINNIQRNIAETLSNIKPIVDFVNAEGNADKSSRISLPVTTNDNYVEDIATSLARTIDILPRVRGLSNLGNTCFFNAVLQCLAQTPYLLEVLKETAEEGEKFELPGGKLKLSEEEESILPPINGSLSAWGQFTQTLHETLEELQTVSGGVFTPRKLLTQLTNKWPQFGGGDQHDSHELLRHLLESVRSEDLRRYQSVILKNLGYTSKVDPQTVEDDTKKKIKFYGEQATDRILRPEQVFRGFLVSTLTCQDCFHTSSRHEYFLDISLPVSVEKPQPPRSLRKPSPEPIVAQQPAISRTQSKKQKRQEKKAKKLANLASSQNKSDSQSSSSESDADVEDNVTDDSQVPKRRILPLIDANGNARISIDNDDLKSPHNPEKRDDTPENPFKDNISGDGPSSSPDMEPLIGNVVCEASLSSTGMANLYNKQQSADLSQEIENLSIENVENERKKKKQHSKRQRTFSHVDWSTTLAPRYQCEDGELSLQSCLNNFTAMELMTGNNKVGCDACTERINGKKGKTVYTNATKQFLISSPPAVLILHLKRFQVGPRCMFRKITKHVTFPTVLDIAPFCGSKVKKLPNIRPHQKKLLYSLYGIVEHSGGMQGGHYVAYVKVRPKFNQKDRRWTYLPQGSKSELDQIDEQKACLEEQLAKANARQQSLSRTDSDDSISDLSSTSSSENEEGAVGFSDETNVTPPPGKWYYVSDSRVQEISEENVLQTQAYLLFYERIF